MRSKKEVFRSRDAMYAYISGPTSRHPASRPVIVIVILIAIVIVIVIVIVTVTV